jgi:hypothetical protein
MISIPQPLYDDTFWSTTVHYLSFRDLYQLILTNSHFYKNIHLGKILSPIIEKRLVTYYGFQDTTFIKDLSVKYGIFLSGYLMSQPNNNQLFILVPQENYEDVEKIVHSKWGYLPIERKFPFCRREPFKHKVLLTSSSNKYVEFLKIVDPLKLTHIQKHPHSDFGQMLIIKGAWLFGKN